MAVSGDQVVGIIQRNERFLRIKTLLNHASYELYFKLFLDSNYGGFSAKPDIIYTELLQHQSKVEELKKNGDINQEDFLTIYPLSQETYLRECKLSLLHKLCQVCVKNFPSIKMEPLIENNEKEATVSDDESCESYIKYLEMLQSIIHDKRLQGRVNKSADEFSSKWVEITDLLHKLGYDVKKVAELRTIGDVENNKLCHAALIRSQTDLLMSECENFFKMTEVNTITLNRLMSNLKDAFALSQEENVEKSTLIQDIKDLKDSIDISANMLKLAKDNIVALVPDLKFWKDKNVEGDIIILDEMLNKLNAQISKQNRSVGDYFNTVSFHIVKIKEKINSADDKNIKILNAPEADPKDKKISLGFVSIGL